MKNALLFATIALLLTGCGKTEPTANTTPVANAIATPNAVKSPSTLASPSVPPTPVTSGAKISQAEEVVFGSAGFPNDWRWIDPDSKRSPTEFQTKNGVLEFVIPPDKDLFGETQTAPRLLKAVSGDFEIETKVKFDPTDSYQGAGLLIFRNDSNYTRLERGFGGVGGGENGVRWDKREDEIFEPVATQEKFPTNAKVVELKFRRIGKEITGFWREPGREWKEVGRYTAGYPDAVLVGIVACNTASPIPVEFSYIKLTPV